MSLRTKIKPLSQIEMYTIFKSVNRFKDAQRSVFTKAPGLVMHMELDIKHDGEVIFATPHVLMSAEDGKAAKVIAGKANEWGHRDATTGGEVRFGRVTGFTQLSDKQIVVVDSLSHCLRLVEHSTGATSTYVGQCEWYGFVNGPNGQFNKPHSVILDNHDSNQLLVTDTVNSAIRTVDMTSKALGTFYRSSSLSMYEKCTGLSQHVTTGDLYVADVRRVYHIKYDDKTFRKLPVSSTKFLYPAGIMPFGEDTSDLMFIADSRYNTVSIVNVVSDIVIQIPIDNLKDPRSGLELDGGSLLIGQQDMIEKFSRK